MKTNFKKIKSKHYNENYNDLNENKKKLTPEEFEEFVIKSGARGSFMIYRSKNKDEEMGLEEI